MATEGFYPFLFNSAESQTTPPRPPALDWHCPPHRLPVQRPPLTTRLETSRAPRLLGNTATSAGEVRGRDRLSHPQAELPSFLISCRPICTPPGFLQGRLARARRSLPLPQGARLRAKELSLNH